MSCYTSKDGRVVCDQCSNIYSDIGRSDLIDKLPFHHPDCELGQQEAAYEVPDQLCDSGVDPQASFQEQQTQLQQRLSASDRIEAPCSKKELERHIPEPVTGWPALKQGQFKGRTMGSYRFTGVVEGPYGPSVELTHDPHYSPKKVLFPLSMVPKHWLWKTGTTPSDPDFTHNVVFTPKNPAEWEDLGVAMKIGDEYVGLAFRPDHVCYLSADYQGKTYFYSIES